MRSKSDRKTRYTAFSKRLASGAAVFAIVIGISVAFSQAASANWQSGLFSFIDNAVTAYRASANTASNATGTNSQTMELLAAAANVDPNPYNMADIAPIDGDALMPDIAATNSTNDSDSVNIQVSEYVVQPGDNISIIADMFDISVDTIKQANHLSGDTISPGQSLVILPVTGVLYSVAANDSLQKISKRYGVSVDDILTYNGLSSASSTIAIGQRLIIPHGKPSASEISMFLSSQKFKVPSSEPLLDPVWDWPSYPGYFICPVPGARLSQGLHGHNAVDLAIAKGTSIHAAAAGTVIISKSNGLWNGGYGNFVMISHTNGIETLYAHMTKTAVSVGQQVVQGQIIGHVGSTGESTGPHVHFEIRNARNPFVDPALCQ